ncbi:MAG: phosphotransferase family protein [Parvibaculales bacterium]
MTEAQNNTEKQDFERRVTDMTQRVFGQPAQTLTRLSGGASQESWRFAIAGQNYVLRRAPGGLARDRATALSLSSEAQILQVAGQHNLPVPQVAHICEAADGLGEAYIMNFIEGETIARKILRDPEFDMIRPQLAAQCGTALAALHNIPLASIPNMPVSDAKGELTRYRQAYEAADHPHPVFELAFAWLADNLPPPRAQTLVHGDFRNGNLMISPDKGIAAILDWELTHLGDPMEDLGWICVPSWRFGQHDLAVGGFGLRQPMYDAYQAAGGIIDESAARFWEILGTLKWGIMCSAMMVQAFESGLDTSVERGSIGRRASETEIDLLRMLQQLD